MSQVSTEEYTIRIPADGESFVGDLVLPEDAAGVVIFAHGSGSSRYSRRNHQVAQQLQAANLATLLMDLLTPAEEEMDELTRSYRFDIPRLAGRVEQATEWVEQTPELKDLPIGYFGASTGAAAALTAAARQPQIKAVVSRGGRPDLADKSLPEVQAPTLLIVGGHDEPVIGMNREAQAKMTAKTQLEIVPGATHLFEEPGALEQVAQLARTWFAKFLINFEQKND